MRGPRRRLGLALRPARIAAPLHVRIGRRILIAALVALARVVLWRQRPRVVAVTGSVGKTTTTGLVVAALGRSLRINTTRANQNNEVGVPAAILGCSSARSAAGWSRVLLRGLALALAPRRPAYPEVLVLEVAAGRPGEIERITRYLRPDVAVVTNVRGVHLEHFRSVEAVASEKSWVVRRLRPGGVAVLGAEDPLALAMRALAPGAVLTYGLSPGADVRVVDLEPGLEGCAGTLCLGADPGGSAPLDAARWKGSARLAFATPLLGAHQVAGLAGAVAVALALGVPVEAAIEALAGTEAPPGRLRAIRVGPGLVVLDDSYNASPRAVLDGLEVLARFPAPRQAVLGDMRELGPDSARCHREVGAALVGRIDRLVAVGPEAVLIAEAAVEHGMAPERVASVATWEDAARELRGGELRGSVLVKGSRAVRLDALVHALCEPASAAHGRPA